MVTAVLFPPSAAECERRGFNPETLCVCVSHCSGVCASTVVYAVTHRLSIRSHRLYVVISLLSFEQTEKMRRRRAYIRKQQTVTERKTSSCSPRYESEFDV